MFGLWKCFDVITVPSKKYVDQIAHITILHENETLKYIELSLDEVTVKFRYLTNILQLFTALGLKNKGKLYRTFYLQ